MLNEIVRFEWRHHIRQMPFAVAAVLYFVFGFAFTSAGFGPANVNINSPYSIAQSVAVLTMFSLFALAAFCADAVVRDRETEMEEIVFTTSVEKLPFLLGRFGGSFFAAFTAFSTSVLGMAVARYMPWQDPERLGDTNPLHYLWAVLLFALPNIILSGTVLFALATATRSRLASYTGSVLIYVLYFASAAATNSPLMAGSTPGANDASILASLLDPFGLSPFFAQTRHWTAIERNTRMLSLSGGLLLNRLTWLAASLAALAAVYRLFSFRLVSQAKLPRGTATVAPGAGMAAPYAPVPADARSDWSAYRSAASSELRAFLLNRPFLLMTLSWSALAAWQIISDMKEGEYGSATYPTSSLILGTLQQPLMIVGTVLIVYLSGELLWRERTLRFSEILHATPASNAVFLAAKCTALAAIVCVLAATGIAAGAILQLASGWTVDPLVLLAIVYFCGAPLVLLALGAVAIQTLSAHKYVGMLLVLFYAVIGQQGQMVGLEHPLWQFPSAQSVTFSEMSGFSGTASFHALAAFRSMLTALALLCAAAAWREGSGALRHLPSVIGRTSRAWRGAALVCVAATAAIAALLIHELNVVNRYETRADRLQWRADYEKKYASFATLPQPRIQVVRAAVDLTPSRRRYAVSGRYVLVNDTARLIDKVLLSVDREIDDVVVRASEPHRLLHDARFRQYLLEPAVPLAPGRSMVVDFRLAYASRGFTSSAEPVAGNGSYLSTGLLFPVVGYRRGYELTEPAERRRHGLPRSARERAREAPQHDRLESPDWTEFDVTVSTAADEMVVAPGALLNTRTEGSRRWFHFHTGSAIPHQYVIASARYSVSRTMHAGVAVEVYHHPAHTQNVGRIVRAATDALNDLGASFGAYPHRELRIAEVPERFRNFSGFAEPGVVFLGERRGFLIDTRDPARLDLVYRRVAHEVAHQWWGYSLVPAAVPGATTLTESLTKYSELKMLENHYGREEVRRSLEYELDLYLSGRTTETGTEPPLSRAEQQSYLYYRKGALVLHGLGKVLGPSATDAALRSLLRKHGGPGGRATADDLTAELKAASPPPFHDLIDQWMNEVVLYDVAVVSAEARPSPAGSEEYEVTLTVDAAKRRVRGAVMEELPLSEPFLVMVFSPAGDTEPRPLHTARHLLRQGRQTVVVRVHGTPGSAVVDPYLTRIDSNQTDNQRAVRVR